MTLQRMMDKVKVYTYDTTSTSLSAYGIPQLSATYTEIEMAIVINSQSNVTDVRYIDVDCVGITKYKPLTTANVIEYNNKKYKVLSVINSDLFTEVLLKVFK